MEFKIKVLQGYGCILAEVLDEEGKKICIGNAESPYMAIKDACRAFGDILDIAEEKLNEKINKAIREAEENDTGERYTLEDVKRRLKEKRENVK